jgi:hypothetical protein
MKHADGRQRGFILIYVVALVAGLTLILFQMQQRRAIPHQTERQIGRVLEETEGRLLLEFIIAGMQTQSFPIDPRYRQFRQLIAEDPARASEMNEAMAQLKALLDSMGFKIDLKQEAGKTRRQTQQEGEGIFFVPDIGGTTTVRLGQRSYQVSILPGNIRPNLNALSYQSLWKYLRHLGVADLESQDLAAALIDWVDADNFLTAGRGAESEHYRGLKPRNGPFQNWQELAYVRGVTPERLGLLREHFVIAPPQNRRVLATTLPKEALSALTDLGQEEIGRLLSLFASTEDIDGQMLAAYRLTLDRSQLDYFDQTVTWEPNRELARIEISGQQSTLHLDFEIKTKRIVGIW